MPASSSASGRPGRTRGRVLRVGAVLVVLLSVAGYLLVRYVSDAPGPARCTVRAAEGEEQWEIEPAQAGHAATIEAVASSRNLPERAVTIALATAMQESSLYNLDHGDRDSLGLFQQRPSQGWGSPEQLRDPVYAAEKFYEGLVEVPDWESLPLTVAAQKVQRSGFPDAYAKHEDNAQRMSDALTGRAAAALNCTTGPGSSQPGPAGDPEAVRAQLEREFGRDVAGAELSSTAGRTAGRAPAGLTLPAEDTRGGWELAHWAVAHAGELRITRISFDGRTWDAARSEEGWRTVDTASAGTREVRLGMTPPVAEDAESAD